MKKPKRLPVISGVRLNKPAAVDVLREALNRGGGGVYTTDAEAAALLEQVIAALDSPPEVPGQLRLNFKPQPAVITKSLW